MDLCKSVKVEAVTKTVVLVVGILGIVGVLTGIGLMVLDSRSPSAAVASIEDRYRVTDVVCESETTAPLIHQAPLCTGVHAGTEFDFRVAFVDGRPSQIALVSPTPAVTVDDLIG